MFKSHEIDCFCSAIKLLSSFFCIILRFSERLGTAAAAFPKNLYQLFFFKMSPKNN
jgi:hypothetical protein